jgi:phosphomannomutase
MNLSSSIFKAYDIRGIVPSTINEDVARGLGRAFGTVAMAEGETTVAVGARRAAERARHWLPP